VVGVDPVAPLLEVESGILKREWQHRDLVRLAEPTKGKLFSDRRGHSIARERLARTLFLEVISDCSSFPKPPNKAPEPTPTAVTPRAMEVNYEVNPWICNRDE
jgi:hypothetical protein